MQPLWPPLPLRGFVDACGGLVAVRPVHRRGSWNVVRVKVDGDPCGPMFPQVIRAVGECLNLALTSPRRCGLPIPKRAPVASLVTVAGSGAWLDHSDAGNVTDTGNVTPDPGKQCPEGQ